MSSNPKPELIRDEHRKIKIDTVSGGHDKDELKQCYFYPTEENGVYIFCNKLDETLATGISSDKPFHFHHDGHLWKIPNPMPGAEPFLIDRRQASGSWWNDAPSRENEEGGTFTAQASGGADEEGSASYATAS